MAGFAVSKIKNSEKLFLLIKLYKSNEFEVF